GARSSRPARRPPGAPPPPPRGGAGCPAGRPPPPPPGWTKPPPLPDPARAIPGWQLTLMAVTIVLLAATLVAIAYPGPGRTPADERKHRPNDDHIRRCADPQGQPAPLAQPTPAGTAH